MNFTGICFECRKHKQLPFVRDEKLICSECKNMKEQTITLTKLTEPQFEKIFDVQALELNIDTVKGFEPEINGDEIVLPIEFKKTDGERVTLGFTLDRKHLRDLLDTLDFPDTI